MKGFTLIELLVAVAILSILAALGGSIFSSVVKDNRDQKRLSDLNKIGQALELYRHDKRSYPATGDFQNLVPEYLSAWPVDPLDPRSGSYRYQAYPDTPTPCSTQNGNCISFVVCALKEGDKNYYPAAGCQSLDCQPGKKCDMGVSSP